MSEPFVALCMPRYSNSVAHYKAASAFYHGPGNIKRAIFEASTSLAIRCFNLLLCNVLNARKEHAFTHMGFLHDDICPDHGWLKTLVEEQEAHNVDFLSAVVPIKTGHGLTSTAVDLKIGREHEWMLRRLTMKEVFQLPETFGIKDIPFALPESRLLLNSGCWVMRLDAVKDIFPLENECGKNRVANLFFSDEARIIQLADGTYVAQDISEDWDWSRKILSLGLTTKATRKAGLFHAQEVFNNKEVWGVWDKDEAYFLNSALSVE